ncbi:unnamed protein product [Clonostachys chloroleuca]|uniref:Nephrocystin-3 n=1 Tax=Clonostachys chloroleuca TaxID=1926264 RepID=A0AA35MCC6_9HYPO|nr:unnamed protein product [Clonostachys chloroleuca]
MQALCRASGIAYARHGKYNPILNLTIGAIFLGTPFRGSGKEGHSAADVRIAIAVESDREYSRELVEYLKPGTQERPSPLDELVQQFGEMINNAKFRFKITCAYETRHTNVSAYTDKLPKSYRTKIINATGHAIVVTEVSACLDGPDRLPLSVRHNMMHKYNSPDDQNFRSIVSRLEEFVEEANDTLSKKGIRKVACNVPFRRDKFIGRDDILQQIHRRLGKTESRLALVGFGGIGRKCTKLNYCSKSRIAIEYAEQTRKNESETSILWVYAKDETSFTQGYRDIADSLCIPGRDDPKVDILKLVNRWLCDSHNGRWVMILDNADEVETFNKSSTHTNSNAKDLTQFIPRSEKGSILITSQNEMAVEDLLYDEDRDSIRIIEVRCMAELEALNLLRAKLCPPLFLENDATELIQVLEGIPLAITHASSFINTRKTTISRYLKLFREPEETQVNLLNTNIKKERSENSPTSTIIKTWQISFNRIRDSDCRAADLLALMSMFDSQGIPGDLVTQHMNELYSIDALATLMHYSFITKHQDDELYDMHALVQLATRNWLHGGDIEHWRRESLIIMEKSFPSGDYSTWPRCAVLLPHAKIVIATQRHDTDELLIQATVANNVGSYLQLRGEFAEAEKMFKLALDGRVSRLGKEHPETLSSTNNLALSRRGQGRYKDAMLLLQPVRKMVEASGKEDPQTLSSIHIIALLHQDQGNYLDAESMYRRALEGRQRVLGEEHADTLASIDSLGVPLRRQGKAEEAAKCHRTALIGREKTLGEDHEDTLSSVNNLSLALRRLKNYQEAETMNQRVLGGRRRVLGENHPRTLTSLDNLGLIQGGQGNYEKAVETHQQAWAGRAKTLGQHHPDTLTSRYNIAVALQSQSKYDEAERIYREVLEAEEKALGNMHPEVLHTVNSLATVLRVQGREEEAERLESEHCEPEEVI